MYGTDHGENDEKQPGDSHERELRDQEAHKGSLPTSQGIRATRRAHISDLHQVRTRPQRA